MTTATFLQPIDIKTFSIYYDFPTERTTSKFQVGFFNGKESPTQLTTFYGNFISTPDGLGLASGSIANAIEVSTLGVEQFKFSALTNNDVVKMRNYVAAQNYMELLSYIFDSADEITGSFGDDTLNGFGGNDLIDSGAGSDTVIFSENFANYTIVNNDTKIDIKNTVTGEIDTLTNTEFLSFADKTLPVTEIIVPVAIISKIATISDNKFTGTIGNDSLNGLAGNDTIIGGLGVDKLTGAKGADVFKFNNVKESGITGKTRDTITDFGHKEGDKIDLSAIDANAKLSKDQAFTFIGTAQFSTTEATAQLRFDVKTQVLYASTDADKFAEFSIKLSGVKVLVADDFIL